MKPYAAWAYVEADFHYNCHICGRLVVKGDRCRGFDVWRAHLACVEQETAGRYEPEHFETEE